MWQKGMMGVNSNALIELLQTSPLLNSAKSTQLKALA